MKALLTLAVIGMTVMMAGGAFGQEPAGKGKGNLFQKADVNNDKKVTFEELKAVAPKMTEEKFKAMDKNADGALTPEERPRPPTQGEILKKADTNNDKKVTFEEFKVVRPATTPEKFKALDTNGDGVLTPEDKPAGDGRGRGHDKAREGRPMQELMTEADKDGDKKVTFEELKAVRPGMTEEKFKAMDTNADGSLTPDDRPAGAAKGPKGPKADCPAAAPAGK